VPGVGVREERGDGCAEFAAVSGQFGPHLGGRSASGYGQAGREICRAGRRVPPGYRSLDRGVDVKVPAEAADRQHAGHVRLWRGQAQGAAEQHGAALAAYQDR